MIHIETWTDNSILRQKSEIIHQNELQKYINIWKDMVKYIKNPKNGWVWLAAPQTWINKRMFVMCFLKDRDDENFKTWIVINPEIISHWEAFEIEEEWCLSLPWDTWDVKRYKNIKVSFIWEDKKQKTIALSWVPARIFQHELDHLDWVLFCDRVDK